MAYFRCGGGGIPSSLKTDMNAVLNKKFGTSTDYPPADWAPTVNLMGPLPEKTIVSSPIADFSDGADDVPLKSCEVALSASLSGYSSVTVHHTDGQTPPVFSEDYTASLGRTIYGGTADIVNGVGTETHAEILLNADNKNSWLYNSQFGVFSFPLTSGSYLKELGNTDMACDSLTVIGQVNAFSDMANKPDNTITLMSIENDSYWRIFVKKTSLTSVDDMKTWITSNPITFVYPVGTPTDFTFDGQEINTRLGYNAFWSDDGDTEVTYRADIDLLLGGN